MLGITVTGFRHIVTPYNIFQVKLSYDYIKLQKNTTMIDLTFKILLIPTFFSVEIPILLIKDSGKLRK